MTPSMPDEVYNLVISLGLGFFVVLLIFILVIYKSSKPLSEPEEVVERKA